MAALSSKRRRRLEAIVRWHDAPQSLVLRARISLMGGAVSGMCGTAETLVDNALELAAPTPPMRPAPWFES